MLVWFQRDKHAYGTANDEVPVNEAEIPGIGAVVSVIAQHEVPAFGNLTDPNDLKDRCLGVNTTVDAAPMPQRA